MAPSVAYEKDCAKKECEKTRDVKYECRGGKDICYSTTEKDKGLEDRCCVKYNCSNGATQPKSTAHRSTKCGSGGGGSCASTKKCAPSSRARSCITVAPKGRGSCGAVNSKQPATASEKECANSSSGSVGYRKLMPTEVSAACYEVRRSQKKYQPCSTIRWQHGKYVRDECGSGIVPVRFDIEGHKRLWCKTPLSMYQATIGELGKQLLCRERTLKRDINAEPPCNVAEYIMPPCRGYYRKYDCIRPCEEEHAYVQRGKKHYRDRVERYWEPCLTEEKKHILNINEYGPHNAALALKMRREHMGIPCW